jgi:hypothetical protein
MRIGKNSRCRIFGHEPENTVRSVRRALELGADGIEVRMFGWQAHKTGRALWKS